MEEIHCQPTEDSSTSGSMKIIDTSRPQVAGLKLKVLEGPPDGALSVVRALRALRALAPSGTLASLCGSGDNFEMEVHHSLTYSHRV